MRTLRYNGGHWKKRAFTWKEVPSARKTSLGLSYDRADGFINTRRG